jgi:mRNA interferase MazF
MQIKRGEIYWVDFEPVKGSEQGGLRPALVVQNDVGNKYSSTTVVVAITRTLPPKPYPFIVVIEPHDSGLPFRSAVNCSQMVTIQQFGSESRFRPIPGDSEVRPVGQLPQAKMEEVNMAILYNLA